LRSALGQLPMGSGLIVGKIPASVRRSGPMEVEMAHAGAASVAAVELRRLFAGVTDNVQARECARTIAGWKPLPVRLPSMLRR